MALTFHKSAADAGGAIGDEISSGVVDALLPEVTLANQSAGATISRKFYVANDAATDVAVSSFSLDSYSSFVTILFESSGDAQVVTDLTGSETDESPITVVIPANSHKSFWVQVDISIGSTITANYNTVDTELIK